LREEHLRLLSAAGIGVAKSEPKGQLNSKTRLSVEDLVEMALDELLAHGEFRSEELVELRARHEARQSSKAAIGLQLLRCVHERRPCRRREIGRVEAD
jgi:hypothetical protein